MTAMNGPRSPLWCAKIYRGWASPPHLMKQLELIAKENGFKGFTATVLKQNDAMIHVFEKQYPETIKTKTSGYEVVLVMDFSPAEKPSDNN